MVILRVDQRALVVKWLEGAFVTRKLWLESQFPAVVRSFFDFRFGPPPNRRFSYQPHIYMEVPI